MLKHCYWNNNGQFEDGTKKLTQLVPIEGNITGKKNRALEKFRIACNCYYDLYNNGLGNSAAEFRRVFKIASSKYRIRWTNRFTDELYALTEEALNDIIISAAQEQGVTVAQQDDVSA